MHSVITIPLEEEKGVGAPKAGPGWGEQTPTFQAVCKVYITGLTPLGCLPLLRTTSIWQHVSLTLSHGNGTPDDLLHEPGLLPDAETRAGSHFVCV